MQEKEECIKCKKTFIKKMIIYPCNMESKRDSYYCCPYCGEAYNIRLMGNEDIETYEVE